MGNTTFTKTVVSSVAWLSAANSGGNGIVKLETATDDVGVGTTAPVHKLTVAGSISAMGNIYLSSGPVGTGSGGGSSFDSTDIRANSGTWDSTYTTVKSNSSTWSTAVSGGVALVGTTVHLADPVTLTQIAEADAVAADKMLIWDESVSAWKYITIEDLQDEIDTGSGGGEANENSFKTFSVSA